MEQDAEDDGPPELFTLQELDAHPQVSGLSTLAGLSSLQALVCLVF
jgi:hypothetical protein